MGHFRRVDRGNISHPDETMSRAMTKSSSGYAFLGVVRPVQDRPMTELSLLEAMQDQYLTRHLTDGKIVFADHR